MKFSNTKVVFGRHETFHLRYSWLPKGIYHYYRNPDYFGISTDIATVELGVGKNMVNAIKYWLQAAQLINNDHKQVTDLGKLIFGNNYNGYDPYLEDQATLWLIHWLVASNTSLATTIAWFFSRFHKRAFDQADLRGALNRYINSDIKDNKRPSPSTIKKDVSVLVRMYAKSQYTLQKISEEALDSPLSELSLITNPNPQYYISEFKDQLDLPCHVLGFAILQWLDNDYKAIVPLGDLIYTNNNTVSISSIFRMTEEAFIVKLEQLVRNYPSYFSFRETAGLRQLYLTHKINPFQLLNDYYSNNQEQKHLA